MSTISQALLCEAGSFMERDIDVWLAEELRVNSDFASWFAEKSEVPSNVVVPAGRVRVSVMGENGETDVEAIFQTTTGRRHALLVENKLEHSLKEEQLVRYRNRGHYGISYGHWESYSIVVFAPATKLARYAVEMGATASISFEQAADRLRRSTTDLRTAYRADFLVQAASEQRVLAEASDEFRVRFWQRIHHLLDERYPGYFVINPKSYPKTTYIAAPAVGAPSYFRLDLKGTKGEVDISFRTRDAPRLVAFLEDRKPPTSRLVFNKVSIALQIADLPPFFVGDGIDIAGEKAMQSYGAAHLLTEFWRENRTFFDELYA